MVKRKSLYLILIISFIGIALLSIYFTFFLKIKVSEFFIFLISVFLFTTLSYGFFVIFLYLYQFFSKIKSELKVFDKKEKAVKDIYRYEQYLNPPELNN